MSSILTIDVGGPDEMVVSVRAAGHAEPREVGERVYAFLGNERSMIQAELMVLPLAFVNTPPEAVRTIRRIFARFAQVPCAGLTFNNGGATVVCSAEIVDEMEQGGPYWLGTITLSEVGDL